MWLSSLTLSLNGVLFSGDGTVPLCFPFPDESFQTTASRSVRGRSGRKIDRGQRTRTKHVVAVGLKIVQVNANATFSSQEQSGTVTTGKRTLVALVLSN